MLTEWMHSPSNKRSRPSKHNRIDPLAQAIVTHLKSDIIEPSTFKDVTGYGIEATVSGQTYRIGKYAFHEGLIDPFLSMEQTLKEQGNTMVYVSNGQSIIALYALWDTIRPEAKTAITSLNALGITDDHVDRR